ncbi:MAG TPA: transaldolase [bacterium]|jgi:transaldolase|nr:transaldolase [bacterium]HNT66544.1 transaldolase [bacterium]HOX86202.1 transaldolase [bacterium]HPG45584.1 transaldolase [bacterium]HPM97637.1 transaldolase [bacterium]
MNKIHKIQKLAAIGQSIWLDHIDREFIDSGALQQLIDEGISGLTSNPSIFQKAIAQGTAYAADIARFARAGKTVMEIYEALVIDDIRRAADAFVPVYTQSNGRDGWVSLEVDPNLADDTLQTIVAAKRLAAAVDRPNLMIKVPATAAGIPAIRALISAGLNINVTLIFGLEVYRQVIEAYLQGMEERPDEKLDKTASVASFFVSRVDSAIDKQLETREITDLQGKIAIANCKLAYQEFLRFFSGDRWEKLARRGARVQRLLWASTSTKNPHYSQTLYIDPLIGSDTINTLPLPTYEIFKNTGKTEPTITEGLEEAWAEISALRSAGINLHRITDELLSQGVKLFSDAFAELLNSIGRECARPGKNQSQSKTQR